MHRNRTPFHPMEKLIMRTIFGKPFVHNIKTDALYGTLCWTSYSVQQAPVMHGGLPAVRFLRLLGVSPREAASDARECFRR